LRLAQSESIKTLVTRHPMQFLIIVHSGANFHMFKDRVFFTHISPAIGKVILGDGKTSILIQGIGTVVCNIGDQQLVIDNVRYVPTLSESIYSLFLHTQLPYHGVFSSFEEGLFLQFPNFKTKALIGQHDIYLDAVPSTSCSNLATPPIVDEQSRAACHSIKDFQDNVLQETEYIDNLLHHLREYYRNVKTKRQLLMEVPAGFRQMSCHNQQLHHYYSLKNQKATLLSEIDSLDTLLSELDELFPPPSTMQSSIEHSETSKSSNQSDCLGERIPIIRSVDKPSTSLPQVMSMTEDYLWSSLGFHRTDTFKQQLLQLYTNSIRLDPSPPDAILNHGDFATLRKSARNTTPVT